MDLGAFFRNLYYVKQMTTIPNEILDNDRWHACLDEARKTLDACTTHEKLGVLHRLSFQFDQIYGLYATRLYNQGFGKN